MDFAGANKAFGEKYGLTYPLLTDASRSFGRDYRTLNDDAAMAKTSRVSVYLRHKRSWFVIDKEGFVRYMKIDSSTLVPSDELIQVVKKYNQ